MNERFIHTTRHKETVCFCCGEKIDASTGARKQHPEEGDIGMCGECGTIYVFEADLGLRPPTEEEVFSLPEKTLEYLAIAQSWIRQKKQEN